MEQGETPVPINQSDRPRPARILVLLAALLGTVAVVTATSPENTGDARPAPAWRAALAGALLAPGLLLWLPYVLVVLAGRDRLDERPRSAGASVIYLLPPLFRMGQPWDAILSSVVTTTLGSGGRVWFPAYALDSIPPRSAGWVEGAQTVSWNQVRQAFKALGESRGCRDTELPEVVAQ